MRNVISAEWTKLLPHKGTWLLVWIYPILFFVIFGIAMLVEGKSAKPDSVAGWIEDSTTIWQIATISLGRYFIAGYFALIFAGEYGWNTWKLVVPHAARWKLIGAKYAVGLALLYIAWIAAALITLVLMWMRSALGIEALPQGLTLGAILSGHYAAMLQGIAPMLIAVTYATTAAVLTRSTLAAFIISLVLITVDELFGRIVSWLSGFGMEWLAVPARILPGYHLDNLWSWMEKGVAYHLPLASGTVISYSFATSFVALTAWIVGLAGLTLWVFRRQDIN